MGHRLKVYRGFTSKYNVEKLVYFEVFEKYEDAAMRENQVKG
jgi:putative endonuclease